MAGASSTTSPSSRFGLHPVTAWVAGGMGAVILILLLMYSCSGPQRVAAAPAGTAAGGTQPGSATRAPSPKQEEPRWEAEILTDEVRTSKPHGHEGDTVAGWIMKPGDKVHLSFHSEGAGDTIEYYTDWVYVAYSMRFATGARFADGRVASGALERKEAAVSGKGQGLFIRYKQVSKEQPVQVAVRGTSLDPRYKLSE